MIRDGGATLATLQRLGVALDCLAMVRERGDARAPLHLDDGSLAVLRDAVSAYWRQTLDERDD